MAYGIQIEVWGERALFTRPELSVERVSYDVITPSAARGLIESIYWHPGMRYTIDRIHVLNPIRFTNVRRNEVKSKALASSEDNPGKFKDIIRRRLDRGQCYSTPYFGTREFAAHFKACDGDAPQGCYADSGERDLGLMLYDMDYVDPQNIMPMFFRAVMRNGVIDVAGSEVFR